MPDSYLSKEGLYQSFKSKSPRFPKLNPFAANKLAFLMLFTSNSSQETQTAAFQKCVHVRIC